MEILGLNVLFQSRLLSPKGCDSLVQIAPAIAIAAIRMASATRGIQLPQANVGGQISRQNAYFHPSSPGEGPETTTDRHRSSGWEVFLDQGESTTIFASVVRQDGEMRQLSLFDLNRLRERESASLISTAAFLINDRRRC
jgi:hypothetical protein